MSRRRDAEIARRLRNWRAPDETGAQARAWDVAKTVYGAAQPAAHRRRIARYTFIPALVAVAGVLSLTPAGAAVHRWIDRTLGVAHASRELFSLPAPGRLLVSSGAGGSWTVAADGSKRRLGGWPEASWSPRGIYVAVAQRNQLTAVDTRGITHWAIARRNISAPRWFAPNGYRVAYLSGGTLRVVAGDGTGDRQLAGGVAPVAPAWRPGRMYELAYVLSGGRVVVRDADTGRVSWTRRVGGVRSLSWTAEGSRLLVATDRAAVVYDGSGRRLATVALSARAAVLDAELAPDGRTLATLTAREVTLTTLPPGRISTRVLFAGDGLRQLAFSPNGQWLLVSWPAADQWVFLRVSGTPRIEAVSRIAEQFGVSRPGDAFPTLDGWCCSATGSAG